jgi:hypothetical protein
MKISFKSAGNWVKPEFPIIIRDDSPSVQIADGEEEII